MLTSLNTYLTIAQRLAFILGSLIYLIFAIIVVKQTTMMTRNVSDKYNPVLATISYLHLTASVLLVFLTLVLL